MKNSLNQSRQFHDKLQLSHHPFNWSYNYLKWAFNDLDFNDKTVLDIGGGNGIYSYYAKYKGAKFCMNLEPFEAGSKNIQILDNDNDQYLSIDWHLHQAPNLIIKMFKEEGMNDLKLRWSPFKRFGSIGRFLSLLGFLPSFFMQSHFNLIIKK